MRNQLAAAVAVQPGAHTQTCAHDFIYELIDSLIDQ